MVYKEEQEDEATFLETVLVKTECTLKAHVQTFL